MENYEKTWFDFWREFCTLEDGTINLDQIQKELHDYKFLIDNVPIVYSHICGLGYPNYPAQTIINEADSKYEKYFITVHKKDILDNIDEEMSAKEIIEFIKEYFS